MAEPYDFWGDPIFQDPVATDPRRIKLSQMIMQEAESPQRQKFDMSPVVPVEESRAEQAQLRKQRQLGLMLQASGDQPLGTAGKSLASADPAGFMQDAARQEQVRRYQNYQANSPGNNMTRLTQAMSALEGSQPSQSKIPISGLDKVVMDADSLKSLVQAEQTFNDDFAQTLSSTLGTAGYSGPLEGIGEWLAKNADKLVTPEQQAAGRWWADFEARVIAPLRNDLFGATLSPNEAAAFERLMRMDPRQPPEEIRARLNDLTKARTEQARTRVKATVKNYGLGHLPMVQSLFGDVLSSNRRASYDTGGQRTDELPPADEGGWITVDGVRMKVAQP